MTTDLSPQDVANVLGRIGPEQIAGDLSSSFGQMIGAIVCDFRRRNLKVARDQLNAAMNEPSYELLIALWQLSLSAGRCVGIRPNELAKRVEASLRERVMQERVTFLIRDVLTLVDSNNSAEAIQRELLMSRPVSRNRTAIKTSLMSAAKGLNVIGLVDLKLGTRGRKQSVVAEIALTNRGYDFMRIMFRYSISISADRHAA